MTEPSLRADWSRRYRIAQWATGNVGARAMRRVIEHPNMDLIGCWVSNPDKVGRDAGELAELAPIGVKATNSIDEIIALKPDCVLYMPHVNRVDEVCRILASGANIVSTRMEYQNPAGLAPADRAAIEEACGKGRTSIHATGSSPGFITEAMPIVLTSIARRVDKLTISEFADTSSRNSPEMLFGPMMGFGAAPGNMNEAMLHHMKHSFSPSLNLIAEAWGMPFDDIQTRQAQGIARNDVVIPAGTAKAGTVAATKTVVSCLHKGKPLVDFEAIWYISADVDTTDGEEWNFRKSGWRVLVEGDTPLEVTIAYPVSDADYPAFTPNLTAHRPVNCVPYVVAAKPGFVTTLDLPQVIARPGVTDIRPFTLAIPQEELDDLDRRLDDTRWPEKETVDDWSQGTPLAMLQELAAYWRADYDWRRCEDRLNGLGQFITEIDGLDIHFLHIRSPYPQALPLLITHGWPGSVIEFMRVIGPLADPVAHGGKAEDAFHVIAPSLPGYGFSGRPARAGWGVDRIGRAWAELMRRLGYARWVAQGGDWGAFVTNRIGEQASEGCIGIHVNMPIARRTDAAKNAPTDEDRRAIERMGTFMQLDSAYSQVQSTRPQSIGYGLVDSPVALAGWIIEKLHNWSDNGGNVAALLGRDAMLDNIMLYWLTGTGASAARLYWESFGGGNDGVVHIPAGASAFPKDIMPAPRSWMEQRYTNMVYWNDMPHGGHFAAWEQPAMFVDELRKCFALMR